MAGNDVILPKTKGNSIVKSIFSRIHAITIGEKQEK